MLHTYKYDNKIKETRDIFEQNMYWKSMKIPNRVTAGHDAKLWL